MAKRKTTQRNARRRSANNPALKNAAYAVLGGAGGSVIGGLLVRAGVKPTTAAVGVTVAGGVAAATLKGAARLAGGGAAAAGAGQLALTWLAAQAKPTPVAEAPKQLPAPKIQEARNAAANDIDAAFARARQELAVDDDLEDEFIDVIDIGEEAVAA